MEEKKWLRSLAAGFFMAGAITAGLVSAGVHMGCAYAAVTFDKGETAGEKPDAGTEGLEYKTFNELNGKKVGIMTGTTFDSVLENNLPDAVPEYFNTFQDMTDAAIAGKIAGYLIDEPLARIVTRESEGIGYIPEYLAQESYAYLVNKSDTELADDINSLLREFEADGTVARIDALWFGSDEEKKVLPDITLTGERGTLIMAVDATTVPFTYMKDGKCVGYDIDLLMRMCERMGYGLKIESMTFSSVIPGVVSGKYDIAAGCISSTPERDEEVLFTDSDYTGGVVMMVKKSEKAAVKTGFYQDLKESFTKTFVRENRWKLILSGLWVTCLISVLSAIAGSVLGFGICMMRRAKWEEPMPPVKRTGQWCLNVFARVFVQIIQGTPLVVILMILYYVVFVGRLSLNSVAVAVIGFSLNFGAYVSEMIRTGIEAVDRGQIEAAGAMGYSRAQTFFKITFPQAARHFLPVYEGEFISMVKMTSVVGYIAIRDLTKVSDIIRSRTYEAFFPLIATAVIYFLLSSLLASVLRAVEKRMDPMRRKRVVQSE